MKKRDLKNDSIKSLFYFYLSSAIIGMLIRSVHGFVDGVFVGNGVSEQALAAVNMSLPLVTAIVSIAILFGVGGATNVSIQFGKGNKDRGQNIFITSLLTMFILVGCIQILYFIYYEQIIYALGANDMLFELMKPYCNTIVAFAPAFALNVSLTVFVRNDSNPKLVMYAQLVGAVANIALNALFIFGMKMGLLGAALGTGIAHVVAILILCIHFINKHGSLKLRFKQYRYSLQELKSILGLGFPSFIAESAFGIVWVTLNLVIINLKGDLGVSAFGITFYVCSMGYSILFGVSQAMQPIISFNFGAKSFDRVKKSFRLGIINAISFGLLFSIFCFAFATPLVKLFGAHNEELIYLAVKANRIMSLSYIFVAYNIVVSTFFQSIGNGKASLVIQVLRGFVFNMILILLLPKIFGFAGVLFAFPIGEVISAIICVILMKKRQKVIDIIL